MAVEEAVAETEVTEIEVLPTKSRPDLKGGKLIKVNGEWELHKYGFIVRTLDEFEAAFIESALAARKKK